MPALVNFTDFVKLTGPVYFSGPDQFLNEAVKNTYTMTRFLKGKGVDKTFQGGDQIQDDVMFDEQTTFQNYHPNDPFTWVMPQVATEMSIDWRFSVDHMAWTDQEVELNGDMSESAARVKYKSIRKKIEQRMWTSMINGFESKIWQDANGKTTDMESADGKEQFSIPSFITENTTNYHHNGWTTIQGIDPANETKWRNQVSTYDYDDPDDTDGDGDGLIDAFDEMVLKVRFIPPDFHKEHFEGQNLQASRQAIYCSRGGLNLYKRMLRASNDTLVRKQDAAYSNPQFDGIDLVYTAHLDTATIDYVGSGTSATELNASTDGYRYWWVNGNYLTPVFHSNRYFKKKEPFHLGAAGQPYTTVCPVDCWWNLFCHSRQRQGIVAPQ